MLYVYEWAESSYWLSLGTRSILFVRVFLLSAQFGAFSFAIQYIIQIIICSVTAILVLFFQPYQKSWMNKLDASVFQIMVIILSISLYQHYLVVAGSGLSCGDLCFNIFLISLPLLIPFRWLLLASGNLIVSVNEGKSKVEFFLVRNLRNLTETFFSCGV